MKTLLIHLSLDEEPYYTLPEGMDGISFSNFKRDYYYYIEKAVHDAKKRNATYASIDLDSLPVLVDDLSALKDFMINTEAFNQRGFMFIEEWNTRKEEAKDYFTAPCISELDGSGFIKKITRR